MSADGLPAKVDAALAGHGLVPGPDSYDVAALLAAAETRGWTAGVEEVDGAAPRHAGRYRAFVTRPRHRGGRWAVHARGRSEIEALARALARALAGWSSESG